MTTKEAKIINAKIRELKKAAADLDMGVPVRLRSSNFSTKEQRSGVADLLRKFASEMQDVESAG